MLTLWLTLFSPFPVFGSISPLREFTLSGPSSQILPWPAILGYICDSLVHLQDFRKPDMLWSMLECFSQTVLLLSTCYTLDHLTCFGSLVMPWSTLSYFGSPVTLWSTNYTLDKLICFGSLSMPYFTCHALVMTLDTVTLWSTCRTLVLLSHYGPPIFLWWTYTLDKNQESWSPCEYECLPITLSAC